MPMTRDRSTAIHEAGHAVIARSFNVRVAGVKLVRPPPSIGFVGMANVATAYDYAVRLNADLHTRLRALDVDATITLAGPVAEASVRGLDLHDKRAWKEEWLIDRGQLRRAVAEVVRLTGVQKNEVHDRIIAETETLVQQHWRTIRRVAKALDRDGELASYQIDGLIADTAAAA
jgi:hypothetical protein